MCIAPITVRVNGIHGTYTTQVPCGRCCDCLKSKQNEWMVRLYHQFRETPKAVFFTLTYNESSVPTVFDEFTGEAWLSVCKRHLQLCFKRFRRYLDKMYSNDARPKIKYFITSEYGPRTRRPHYHGLIFGIDKRHFLPFLEDWFSHYGFYNASDITFSEADHIKTARYVSKYCTKGVFENPFIKEGLVEPTFHLISKGIGSSYIVQLRDFHLAKDSLFFKPGIPYSDDYLDLVISRLRCLIPNTSNDGQYFSYKMPKYYKTAIFKDSAGIPLYFLQAALTRRILQVHDELHLRQLEQLCTEWCCSLDEAEHILILQNMQDARTRESEAFESLADFYDRSIL